jgi:hypothetical protein
MTATVDASPKQMARFVVMYDTPSDLAAFERRYNDVHIPLAKQYPGLRRFRVSAATAARSPRAGRRQSSRRSASGRPALRANPRRPGRCRGGIPPAAERSRPATCPLRRRGRAWPSPRAAIGRWLDSQPSYSRPVSCSRWYASSRTPVASDAMRRLSQFPPRIRRSGSVPCWAHQSR